MIFIDDHPPPHVHVFGDGEAKIEIGSDHGGPNVVYAHDMSAASLRRAVQCMKARRDELLSKWIDIHG